jgi:hypothetical protein
MRTKLFAAAALALGLVAAAPAGAHHSFNMFSLDKVVTVRSTIKSVSWKMPHVWVYATITTEGGASEDWGFEAHAPNLVARKGWGSSTLKPGDKVAITMHPMKDGAKAGSLIYFTTPGGQKLWNADSLNNP